ncbi:MAG: hypothetical protein C4536_16055 [Actinobacteria bacterium]|jgi:predicted small lipoprotein YifL|nr:MAG: hypothetical protein C4536_16055 [Actinomycetota bacterium]
MVRRIITVLLAVAVLAALAGCGDGGEMSLSDYRKTISELHDSVAWDMGDTVEELNDLDFKDFYDLPDLRMVFLGAEEIFAAAWDIADPIYPPPQAEMLHVDLLDFYAEGAESMRDVQNALGFFEVVLPMLRDVENLALPDLPENAGVPEIKAAAAEDRRTMEGYMRELEGIDPPDDLQPYREKLEGFFRSIDEAVAAVDQSVTPENFDSFAQFRQWFATALVESESLWGEAMSYLDGMSDIIDHYIEMGKELAARIQVL